MISVIYLLRMVCGVCYAFLLLLSPFHTRQTNQRFPVTRFFFFFPLFTPNTQTSDSLSPFFANSSTSGGDYGGCDEELAGGHGRCGYPEAVTADNV
ncbi:hypothetical protein L1987_58832 [Smallanthus sonchifolius]|uniref:Uncharacterized protein n=1 Tax=Smallanthus sonchifolius TaxID=185202 RepID=A0ACB9D3R8_9ASTR|nr:hypothetical protein L1987_58832 [Smallanthus sonchifolius]